LIRLVFLVALLLAGFASLARADAPATTPAAPLVLPPPVTVDAAPAPSASGLTAAELAAKLEALNAGLQKLQTTVGAPAQIPAGFWQTKTGTAFAITLQVAVGLASAAGSAASLYAAFK
jgi:hypothetical protein